MKINQLSLRNYRCFENFSIKFADTFIDENNEPQPNNLHVLLAPNMVGKSALLKALRVAISTTIQKIKANPAPAYSLTITSDEHRIIGDNPFSDKAREVEITAEGQFTRWNGHEWEETHYRWKRYKEDYSGRNTKTVHLTGDIAKDVNATFNRVVEKQEGINPMLVYLGTEYIHQQKAVTDTLNQNGTAKQGYWYCLDDKSMESYVFDWFELLFDTTLEQQRTSLSNEFYQGFARDTLDTFKLAVKKILPEVLEVEWIVNTLSNRKDKIRPVLVFKIEGQGVRTYQMLSDGYRYLILLVGELVTRATLLNKHLRTSTLQEVQGIILIDEFGIHLHPSLQAEALSRLADLLPKVQFIITTHSPLLINGLRKEQLHLIGETPTGERVVEHPQEDAIGLGAEGILKEMFGLSTTFDQVSIDQNEEYKHLLYKKNVDALSGLEEQRLEELGKRLAPLRLDPTLIIRQDDPITELVKERIGEESKRSIRNDTVNQQDLKDRVNSILDNILQV